MNTSAVVECTASVSYLHSSCSHDAEIMLKTEVTVTGRWDNGSMFIDGAWTADETGRVGEVIDPATEVVIGSVPDADKKAAHAAIAAARRAFDDGPWPRMSTRRRAAVLRRMANILDERHDALKADGGSARWASSPTSLRSAALSTSRNRSPGHGVRGSVDQGVSPWRRVCRAPGQPPGPVAQRRAHPISGATA